MMGSGYTRKNARKLKYNKIPGSAEGISEYYRERGFRENPLLELPDKKKVTSFVKPLPDGRRIHIRVYKGRKYYTIDKHIDSYDPGRHPINHLIDFIFPAKHYKIRVRRRDYKRRRRREN